jgi:hypothetical protein
MSFSRHIIDILCGVDVNMGQRKTFNKIGQKGLWRTLPLVQNRTKLIIPRWPPGGHT